MDLVGIEVAETATEASTTTDDVTYLVTYKLYAFDEKADKNICFQQQMILYQ